jgi:hypothetical protein
MSFLNSLWNEAPEQADFEDGYLAAAICDALFVSAAEGRSVDVASVVGSRTLSSGEVEP